MGKAIYIFSGLGADERAFQFMNFFEYKPVFIKWIDPLLNETLESYAARISEKIKEPKPILIGLSFGGIIATEIAKIIVVEKVILISSVRNKNEIPFILRVAGKLKLHKLLPASMMKKDSPILYWLFGIKSDPDKKILSDIINDTDPRFLSWAIDRILTWKHAVNIKSIIKIHGSADRLFPSYKNADAIVTDGGHLMVLNKAGQISSILYRVLKK